MEKVRVRCAPLCPPLLRALKQSDIGIVLVYTEFIRDDATVNKATCVESLQRLQPQLWRNKTSLLLYDNASSYRSVGFQSRTFPNKTQWY